MAGLALKNFRGFEKSLFLLDQVNFFVGENSTGKTSVISLIDILSNSRFYYTEDLASEYCDFSSFSDISSVEEKTKSFSIGYFRNSYSNSKLGLIDAISFNFTNNEGVVSLKEIQFISNNFAIEAHWKLDRIQINVSEANLINYEFPLQVTHELMWGVSKKIKGKIVKKVQYKFSELPMPSPLLCALNVLSIESIRKTENDPIVKTRSNPRLFPLPTWIAPIRAKPERVNTKYTRTFTPEGDHIPSILRKAYGKRQNEQLQKRLANLVSDFGRESHLFDELKIKEYGNDQSSPFEINVRLANSDHRMSNVGYGVSQALPILIEIGIAQDSDTFIIQQPEVHLHPRAQAAFGNLFFEMALSRKHRFFIETHSDFLIDRFRLMLNKSKKRIKPTAQVMFFSKKDNNSNKVDVIQINRDGSYAKGAPVEFKSFFLNEEFNLLSI